MTGENDFDFEETNDEELVQQALNEAIESATITLRMAENCFEL